MSDLNYKKQVLQEELNELKYMLKVLPQTALQQRLNIILRIGSIERLLKWDDLLMPPINEEEV